MKNKFNFVKLKIKVLNKKYQKIFIYKYHKQTKKSPRDLLITNYHISIINQAV